MTGVQTINASTGSYPHGRETGHRQIETGEHFDSLLGNDYEKEKLNQDLLPLNTSGVVMKESDKGVEVHLYDLFARVKTSIMAEGSSIDILV